jgi:hypothetical protein
MKTISIDQIQLDDEVELDMETFAKGASFIHVFKCQVTKCRLEFAVFSWKKDWPELFKAHCPECGSQDSWRMLTRAVARPIYEIVNDPALGR